MRPSESELQEEPPASPPRPLTENIEYIRSIVGDDIGDEKIKFHLRGADGNVQVAINHILDEELPPPVRDSAGKEELDDSRVPPARTSQLEKVLYELAEEVKCPLCLSYFNNPVLLSCYHTFCMDCVAGVVKSDNSVQCPLCRKIFPLDDKGIKGLKGNHYLANIVEKLKAAQSTKMCAECQHSLCTVYCKQCKAFLCSSCNDRVHSIRLLNEHDRVAFEDCFFAFKQPAPSTSNPITPPQQVTDIMWEEDIVIPFNVKKAVCIDLFTSWAKDLWFAPSDLQKKAILQEFKAVYIPYFAYEVDSLSRYNGMVGYSEKFIGGTSPGENSSAQWGPALGVHHKKYTDVLICAANTPYASLLSSIEPWKMEQCQPFTLQHALGTEVRAFTMDAEKGWRQLAKPKVEQLAREACRKKMGLHARTDNVVSMYVDTSFTNRKAKRLFVPIYMTTYEYHGKFYYFVVNGSTAKSHGQRPYSVTKLSSISFTGLGAAMGLLSMRPPV